jgi:hypothetical protein
MTQRLTQIEGNRATESELLADGWRRCFITDEPRLAEVIEAYEEMGMEVRFLPVDLDDRECSECMKADPCRYRVIFTRPRGTDG